MNKYIHSKIPCDQLLVILLAGREGRPRPVCQGLSVIGCSNRCGGGGGVGWGVVGGGWGCELGEGDFEGNGCGEFGLNEGFGNVVG